MFKAKVDDELDLCLVNEQHASRYVELITQNYDYLSRWLPWPAHSLTEEDSKKFIKRSLHIYADGTGMDCAIEYKKVIVGNIGYNNIDHNIGVTEIGYWLGEKYQGKGIVTRSCRYLMNHALSKMGLDKVQISVATENVRSRSICERLGMNLEGIITNRERVKDKVLDHAIYGFHEKDLQNLFR